MNLNKVQLIGRITQDLELKTTQTGRNVLSFSVATNRTWKDDKGEKQERTDFHNIVSWGKQAETIAQYFIKGQEIYCEGRLETRTWEGEDGKKNYRTEVMLEKFEFGQKPKGAENTNAHKGYDEPENAVAYPEEEIDPDDIPF